MKISVLSLAAVATLFSTTAWSRPVILSKRATAADWANRAIYQILTDRFARTDESTSACSNLSDYCGGTYAGITAKLDYISDMGFDAIWISPIPKNSPGGYHGYWATDFYGLNENFGSEEDLKALVDAAHAKKMYVMLDVVANHAGPTATDGDYSGYTFNSTDRYHPQCKINYSDQKSVEQCWVADVLPDINTEDDSNVEKLNDIVSTWVQKYGFDGIRIDTVKHVRKDFWPGYQSAAGVFATGEVFDGNPATVADYQNYMDSVINYPIYYALNDVFASGKAFGRLSEVLNANKAAFKNVDVLPTFVDNHDNPRFLNTNKDIALFKNALAYVLLGQGIPVVYYGSEQSFAGGADPANRESLWSSGFDTSADVYKFIATVNGVRQKSDKSVTMDVDVQDKVYAFTHGNALVVLNNYGSGAKNEVTVKLGSSIPGDGALKDVISGASVTASNGAITFTLTDGLPAIFTASS
ncbi:a-amylase [Dichotomocladium elegans]|nr:a-amylase [Dichotomocladium elegans]